MLLLHQIQFGVHKGQWLLKGLLLILQGVRRRLLVVADEWGVTNSFIKAKLVPWKDSRVNPERQNIILIECYQLF